MKYPLASALIAVILAIAPAARAVDVFELENAYLQTKLDEAWNQSVAAQTRRGGINEREKAIFAMSWLNETGSSYDAFHLAAGMVNFTDTRILGQRLGHGPTFGFSRFASTHSTSVPIFPGLKLIETEAAVDHYFFGWNFGTPSVFAEIGYRWRTLNVDATKLSTLTAKQAAPYVGMPAKTKLNSPYFKIRTGGEHYDLNGFFQPSKESFSDPELMYIEPAFRFGLGPIETETKFSYQSAKITGDVGKRLAVQESIRFGSMSLDESESEGSTADIVAKLGIASHWVQSAAGLGEAVTDKSTWVYRIETEPYYLGAWYNEVFGTGWGVGLSMNVMETGKDLEGTNMRIHLRYLKNYILPEPSDDPVAPWLLHLNATGGW